MTTDKKQGVSSRFKYFVVIGVLAMAILVALLWFNRPGTVDISSHQVPKLAEQPTDTLVAQESLHLHHWQGDENVDVYFVPTEVLPIVDIRIDFDAGASRDGKLPGLSRMTGLMLSEGTLRLSTDEFSEAMEGYGAKHNVDIERDRFGITLRAMANKDLDAVVMLLIEMMTEPRFAKEDFQRVKQQWLVKLAQDLQKPSVLAARKLYKTIYGEHPYGHPVNGTLESIEALTEENLKAFHQRNLNAKNVVITLVGGIHRDKARQIANKIIMALPKGETLEDIPEVPKLALEKENRIEFDSKQAHVMMGQLGRQAIDEARYPLIVGNHILGGHDMTARLFQKVREERGLAYSVYSYFNPLQQMGPFVLSLHTQGNNTDEAVSIMRNTLSGFVTEGPTEEELAAAKLYLVGSFPLQLSSNQQILDIVSHMAFYQLPNDFLDEYTREIEKVTVADIKQVFQERIHPQEMALVVVGGKKK